MYRAIGEREGELRELNPNFVHLETRTWMRECLDVKSRREQESFIVQIMMMIAKTNRW